MGVKKITDFGMLLFIGGLVIGSIVQRRYDEADPPTWAGLVLGVVIYLLSRLAVDWWARRLLRNTQEPCAICSSTAGGCPDCRPGGA